MKHFLKAAAAWGIVMIIDIIINVICNGNGVDLNSTGMSMASAFGGIALYHVFIRNEKDKEQ